MFVCIYGVVLNISSLSPPLFDFLRYKEAVISKLKAEARADVNLRLNPDLRQLPDEGGGGGGGSAVLLPDYAIKCGALVKQGDVVRNWKERWFIAKNAADNFVIEYYEAQVLFVYALTRRLCPSCKS